MAKIIIDGQEVEVGINGEDGEGVPVGGTTGQILTKYSDVDFDTTWSDMPTIPDKLSQLTNDEGFVTETQVDNKLSDYATTAEVDTKIAPFATTAEVDEKVSAMGATIIGGAPEDYDTLKEVYDYISSDQTAMQALNSAIANKVDKTTTVNGKALSNSITLSANDIGARPDTWMPTAEEVGARPITWTPTASEVGALPSTTTIPTKTSQLTNDSGFLTNYTETDPTVPAWAKAASKPTYTASEVGAFAATSVIPVANGGTGVTSIDALKTALDIPQAILDFFGFSKTLSENSWEAINRASYLGIADKLWSVGDEIDIVVNGETLTLQIYGFNHDDLTSGGKAGITFGMKNLMAETRQMNSSNTNVGGFTGSDMYDWLQNTVLPTLPTDLQSVIKHVNKKTNAGNQSTVINTDSMKLFLFSCVETGLRTTEAVYKDEGTQYPIFTDNTSRIKRLANGAGSANNWWERSPNATYSTYFCTVSSHGSASGYIASTSYGVCFGFCV